MVDDNEQVHCALIFAKARVTPLKQITVPRLELTANLLSAKICAMLKRELEYENVNEFFLTILCKRTQTAETQRMSIYVPVVKSHTHRSHSLNEYGFIH